MHYKICVKHNCHSDEDDWLSTYYDISSERMDFHTEGESCDAKYFDTLRKALYVTLGIKQSDVLEPNESLIIKKFKK